MCQGRIGDAYLTRNERTVLVLCGAKTLSKQKHNIHTMTLIARPKPTSQVAILPTRPCGQQPDAPSTYARSRPRTSCTACIASPRERFPGMAPIKRCHEQMRQDLWMWGAWGRKGKRVTWVCVSGMRRGNRVTRSRGAKQDASLVLMFPCPTISRLPVPRLRPTATPPPSPNVQPSQMYLALRLFRHQNSPNSPPTRSSSSTPLLVVRHPRRQLSSTSSRRTTMLLVNVG